MKNDIEIINKYGDYSLDLQSFALERETGDIIISLFNGENHTTSPTQLILQGLTVSSFLKQPYIDKDSLTPYGPAIIKVTIIEGLEILKIMKTLNPHIDYHFFGKYHSGEDIEGMSYKEIENLGFNISGPKKIFHISMSGGMDGDFLCQQLVFNYLDFDDGERKKITLKIE